MTPEKTLKKRIRLHLRSIGAYTFSPVPWGMGQGGVDFFCCLRGKFVAVEVKTEGGRPTPRQRLTLEEVERAGGIAFWCDSYDGYLRNMQHHGLAPHPTLAR